MDRFFFISPFSKAVTDLENTIPATLADARKSPEALCVLKSEADNLRYLLAKIDRATSRSGNENTSGLGAGVLI